MAYSVPELDPLNIDNALTAFSEFVNKIARHGHPEILNKVSNFTFRTAQFLIQIQDNRCSGNQELDQLTGFQEAEISDLASPYLPTSMRLSSTGHPGAAFDEAFEAIEASNIYSQLDDGKQSRASLSSTTVPMRRESEVAQEIEWPAVPSATFDNDSHETNDAQIDMQWSPINGNFVGANRPTDIDTGDASNHSDENDYGSKDRQSDPGLAKKYQARIPDYNSDSGEEANGGNQMPSQESISGLDVYPTPESNTSSVDGDTASDTSFRSSSVCTEPQDDEVTNLTDGDTASDTSFESSSVYSEPQSDEVTNLRDDRQYKHIEGQPSVRPRKRKCTPGEFVDRFPRVEAVEMVKTAFSWYNERLSHFLGRAVIPVSISSVDEFDFNALSRVLWSCDHRLVDESFDNVIQQVVRLLCLANFSIWYHRATEEIQRVGRKNSRFLQETAQILHDLGYPAISRRGKAAAVVKNLFTGLIFAMNCRFSPSKKELAFKRKEISHRIAKGEFWSELTTAMGSGVLCLVPEVGKDFMPKLEDRHRIINCLKSRKSEFNEALSDADAFLEHLSRLTPSRIENCR